MNNTSRRLSLMAGALASVVFLGIIVYQTDLIGNLRQGLEKERRRADKAEEEVQVKSEMVEQLTTENEQLQDSIESLRLEIATLEETIQEQKTKISQLNRIISTQADKVARLTRKIETLEAGNAANLQEINRLEAERDAALQDMAEMDRKRQELQSSHQQTIEKKEKDQQVVSSINKQMSGPTGGSSIATDKPGQSGLLLFPEREISGHSATNGESSSRELYKVLAQTGVIYHEVALRKKSDGSNLKKTGRDNWQYTLVSLDLDHPEKQLLAGEVFVMTIHDMDANTLVPMNEENAEFPDSPAGTTGYLFRYRGEALQLRYKNNQEKPGSNYEIRLYYRDGVKYVPLQKGNLQIVRNGEVVTR